MYSMPERGGSGGSTTWVNISSSSQARLVKIDEKLFNRNGPAAFRFGDLHFAVQGDKNLRQIGERFAGSEIAADRAHVAHADVGDFSFRFRKHRKFFSDEREVSISRCVTKAPIVSPFFASKWMPLKTGFF